MLKDVGTRLLLFSPYPSEDVGPPPKPLLNQTPGPSEPLGVLGPQALAFALRGSQGVELGLDFSHQPERSGFRAVFTPARGLPWFPGQGAGA